MRAKVVNREELSLDIENPDNPFTDRVALGFPRFDVRNFTYLFKFAHGLLAKSRVIGGVMDWRQVVGRVSFC